MENIPKWYRELQIFSKIKPLIILEGNTMDLYQYPIDGSINKGAILRLDGYLHYFYKDKGYDNIIFYDSLHGFYNNNEDGYLTKFIDLIPNVSGDDLRTTQFKDRDNTAPNIVRNALLQNKSATVVVMNYVSRYITSPEHPEQQEINAFTLLLQSIMDGKDVKTEHGTLKNLLVMIVNKINDLPPWFYLDNPNGKIITIDTPTKEEREALIKGENFSSFFESNVYKEDIQYYSDHTDELLKIQDKFIALTEGFSFTEINGLRRLCKNEKISIRNFCDVVDLFKYGITENPWKKIDINLFKNAYEYFQRRVKGQKYPITKTLDVVKRAVVGLSGMQGSSHTRPKGVLFFAGPTGTGKTETAKTLAEILFGDESCCIRFDMSEYGQSHSDQKLLGAPPGYIGYEAGGQLTNAVKKNPFSILLFDEIEKAHPTILDKFLQILEDGRMTDGQGNTVYFSECIIIFTSNLGIYKVNEMGNRTANVNDSMSYLEIESKIRAGIGDYFKLELGRPEILNRIGENIVVFDYIRPNVAMEILRSQIEKIQKELEENNRIRLSISNEAMKVLELKSLSNLSNGGRGIGNIVENMLINPISRYLFDNGIFENATIEIKEILSENLPIDIKCEIKNVQN